MAMDFEKIDLKDEAPTLTFDFMEEEEAPLVQTNDAQVIEEVKKDIEQTRLSPQEKKMVDDFATKINLNNSKMILQYGAGAQKKIADFSETALNSVKTKDLGEVGELLTGVVTQLKDFQPNQEEEKERGIFGFLKKKTKDMNNLKVKYASAEANINKICKVLEENQRQLLKDVSMLDKMYELNKTYFKELSMYILAGQQKLEETRKTELPSLMEQATRSNLPEDAQAVNDLNDMCSRFEKKLHDLELTRMISIQMAPQIRLIQNNDILMSEKIQSTIVNTIPLWKSQMILALGVAHQEKAVKAQREVTNMTNELLRRNAETLKMSTIETAKESERSIVDIETLKHTNESLISTLDEVLQIQADGRRKREEAQKELAQIENELKQKLLTLAK
ncbi:MAG: toxic anion resistance protein [Lachnospiraceae bacterium]